MEEMTLADVYWFRWRLSKFIDEEVKPLQERGWRHKFAPVIEGRLRKTIVCVLERSAQGTRNNTGP